MSPIANASLYRLASVNLKSFVWGLWQRLPFSKWNILRSILSLFFKQTDKQTDRHAIDMPKEKTNAKNASDIYNLKHRNVFQNFLFPAPKNCAFLFHEPEKFFQWFIVKLRNCISSLFLRFWFLFRYEKERIWVKINFISLNCLHLPHAHTNSTHTHIVYTFVELLIRSWFTRVPLCRQSDFCVWIGCPLFDLKFDLKFESSRFFCSLFFFVLKFFPTCG